MVPLRTSCFIPLLRRQCALAMPIVNYTHLPPSLVRMPIVQIEHQTPENASEAAGSFVTQSSAAVAQARELFPHSIFTPDFLDLGIFQLFSSCKPHF